MREIKFRGKRIDTGEWVYGDLMENQGRYFIYHATSETTLKDEDNSIIVLAEEVNLDTVGQYTGLKDKINNACIYEGDVLSLNGNIIGNKYENKDLLKSKTNLPIEGICTKKWCSTYKEAIKRGCYDAE